MAGPRLSACLCLCCLFILNRLDRGHTCNLSDSNICFVHHSGGLTWTWKATLEAIKSVRAQYPASPYVLVTDGGYDLSTMAAAYNASFWRDDKVTAPGPPYGGLYTPARALKFINRMKTAASRCGGAEYLVFFEDDNVCHRRVLQCPEADGNGLVSDGTGFNPAFREYIINRTGAYRSVNFNWGLMGGAFIRTEAILKMSFEPSDIRQWASLDPATTVATDGVLTAGLLASGYSVMGWSETTQSTPTGAFEHGVKQWYRQPLSAEEQYLAPTKNVRCSLQEFTQGAWVPGDAHVADGYKYCGLDTRQDCRSFRNNTYLSYSWVPDNFLCPLEHVSPPEFLSCFRNKRIVFVGDSLARNMQQALQCALMQGPEPTPEHQDGYKLEYDSHYAAYGVDVMLKTGGQPTTHWRDYLWPADLPELATFDVVVLSSGSHWRRDEAGVDTSSKEGIFKAVQDRVDALLRLPESVQIIWRGPDLNHWSRDVTTEPWNAPCGDTPEAIHHDPVQLWIRKALREITAGTRIHFMDMSEITGPRPDGHPGDLVFIDGRHDCLHWCLPGIPDVWNDILFTYMCRHLFAA